MGPYQNAVQGAVILSGAVVGTLLYGAFNAGIGMAVHRASLLSYMGLMTVWGEMQKETPEKPSKY